MLSLIWLFITGSCAVTLQSLVTTGTSVIQLQPTQDYTSNGDVLSVSNQQLYIRGPARVNCSTIISFAPAVSKPTVVFEGISFYTDGSQVCLQTSSGMSITLLRCSFEDLLILHHLGRFFGPTILNSSIFRNIVVSENAEDYSTSVHKGALIYVAENLFAVNCSFSQIVSRKFLNGCCLYSDCNGAYTPLTILNSTYVSLSSSLSLSLEFVSVRVYCVLRL